MDQPDAPFSPTRELLWRFSPPALRDDVHALFSLEQQLEESLRPTLEHSVAHARLAWWQEELQRLHDGKARHPLTQKLSQRAQAHSQPPPDLRAWTDCVSIDLACLAFETRTDLDRYFEAWSASVFQGALGLPRAWGATLRELELLTDFLAHAWQGRIYWPLGQDPAAADPWRSRPLAAPESERLRERLQELERKLREYCRAHSPTDDRLAMAQLWSAIVVREAHRAREALPDRHQPTRLYPLTRTLEAWWFAVQIQRGTLPTRLR